ncbi:MAG: hypothetical protein M3P08_13335 [Thermoproteota archaeon]|nr:hypothetical protein [Thermoproteota archaeon]
MTVHAPTLEKTIQTESGLANILIHQSIIVMSFVQQTDTNYGKKQLNAIRLDSGREMICDDNKIYVEDKDTIMDDLRHMGQDEKKWMKSQMSYYNAARLHSTPEELQKLGLDFGALDHMIAEKVLGRNEYGLNGAIIKCRNGCGHDIYYDRKFRSAGSLIPMDAETNEEHKCKK